MENTQTTVLECLREVRLIFPVLDSSIELFWLSCREACEEIPRARGQKTAGVWSFPKLSNEFRSLGELQYSPLVFY
jgi:hypothetical protein